MYNMAKFKKTDMSESKTFPNQTLQQPKIKKN